MNMDPELAEQREEFREQLSLGLVHALEKLPGVQDVVLHDRSPSDTIAITTWEQRYSTMLPQEIKDFFLATDGFKLTWNFKYAGEILPLGNLVINRISDMKRIAGLRHSFDTDQPTLLDLEVTASSTSRPPLSRRDSKALLTPQFGLRWKMFELDGCDGNGRVCLVFPPKPDPQPVDDNGTIQLDIVPPTPQVWFLDRAYEWHFLAPTFTAYFRMMLVHLGLPQWQALFTPFGPTPWAEQVINLIAPHLLVTDEEVQAKDEGEDYPITSIDPAIFKVRSKSSRKLDEQ